MLSMKDGPFGCTRVLVVEDQARVSHWLANDVAGGAFPGVPVDVCATLAQAFAWLDAHRPMLCEPTFRLLVMVDLGLPDGSGIDLIRRLSAHGEQVLPVVTTVFDDDASLCDAIAAGAQGYLLKEHPTETLIRYLRRIEQGEPPLTPRMARRILACMQRVSGVEDSARQNPDIRLSPRETEVLGIIGRGLRVGEAAQVLGLTEHTVASYVKVIYRKLNISSRAEAALEASRRRLV